MFGMGRTMKSHMLDHPLGFEDVPLEMQARDLKELIKIIGLEGDLNLVGLSYGGGLGFYMMAHHPDLFNQYFPLAPYIAPIKGQEKIINDQIAKLRRNFPSNIMLQAYSDEQLFNYLFRYLVAAFPVEEPDMLFDFFWMGSKLEWIYRMALGIRPYLMKDLAHLFPDHSINLIVAGADEYISRDDHVEFWRNIPERAKARMITLSGVKHRITHEHPQVARLILKLIEDPNFQLEKGREFLYEPASGLLIPEKACEHQVI